MSLLQARLVFIGQVRGGMMLRGGRIGPTLPSTCTFMLLL